MKEQVRMAFIAKAGDGRRVNGDAVLKSPGQLLRHDGNIFLPSKYIAERQTDEFHVLLPHILENFFFRIFHNLTCFLYDCC